MKLIDKDELLKSIAELKKSPWYFDGKESSMNLYRGMYNGRADAVEMIVEMCVKNAHEVKAIPTEDAEKLPFCPYCGHKREG